MQANSINIANIKLVTVFVLLLLGFLFSGVVIGVKIYPSIIKDPPRYHESVNSRHPSPLFRLDKYIAVSNLIHSAGLEGKIIVYPKDEFSYYLYRDLSFEDSAEGSGIIEKINSVMYEDD